MKTALSLLVVLAVFQGPDRVVSKALEEDDDEMRKLDSCLEHDMHYQGLALPKSGGDNNYGETATAVDCQKICRQTAGCRWFNWQRTEGSTGCWLKTGRGDIAKDVPGGVTGPTTCTPKCDSLYNGILIKGWRNNFGGMSEDDIRNTVIVELAKEELPQKGRTATDFHGLDNNALLAELCHGVKSVGWKMTVGSKLYSNSRRCYIELQTDGNLVLYREFDRKAFWNSGTQGKDIPNVQFQSDGNLVLYTRGGDPVWSSHTHSKGAKQLAMQDDGNFVMRDGDGKEVFSTHTGGKNIVGALQPCRGKWAYYHGERK